MMRVALQPAYVLHSRPYRDSSALVEMFTAEHGRLSLVARGARNRGRKGSLSSLLQPFIPLLISFSGRAELKTLGKLEAAGGGRTLRGERLYSGLYLNELLVRLLHRQDAHPRLFAAYGEALDGIAGDPEVDVVLRRFELRLLDDLGYSVNLAFAGDSGDPVEADMHYCYHPGTGLVEVASQDVTGREVYAGADLLAFARGEYSRTVRSAAKRLLREALSEHLGGMPLHSRELFRGAGRASSGGGRAARPGEAP